jgi:N-acetylglucosaminyldiphosphoundecaprenol N-acetyl-beta-D-mannosaminyltransferase
MFLTDFRLFTGTLSSINLHHALITTINAHSYNISRKDKYFCEALKNSDVLLPDGVGVVLGVRWLTGKKIHKIAGADLFEYEMCRMQRSAGKVFFLGSSDMTLQKIRERINKDYPAVKTKVYPPPYKPEFSGEDNNKMIDAVNAFCPDVLFVGMTAPKQEKWAYKHKDTLKAGHICCIGAVFDFYAETFKRAPKWMISAGLEWFYRLIRAFPRMWRRILIGNMLFICQMIIEKGKKYPCPQPL